MGVKWTSEQQSVIDLRDRNLLVSAAAGSGKTAVLVERIIKKITDKENPVDIDRILVVTFTKAAAAEMRERISSAIENLRTEHPDDENLERQSTLVHNAQITTIDSFCLFVVRNHFGEINLDPNFRIADAGEIKLLENDVLASVFEENYEKADNEGFLELVDMYSGSRNDDKVRQMILQIYHMAQSDSWPKKWIESLADIYDVSSVEALIELPIIKKIAIDIKLLLADYRDMLEELLHISLEPDGPQKYAPTLEADMAIIDEIIALDDYVKLSEYFRTIEFGALSAIRDKSVDSTKKSKVQDMRTVIKKSITGMKEEYFSMNLEAMLEQISVIRKYASQLISLSLDYTEAVEKAKREKRIVDFGDIEHFALRIFVDETTNKTTATAKEFSKHFDEIMIDEYQDSNQVQEDIMCAISKMESGHNNMFMVGDVKQSIYRFRLARPELFMQKYNSYSLEASKNQRIDLHKNFRSRKEVIDFANDIFYKIMQVDVGNVSYDDDSALYTGADYKVADDMDAELMLIDIKDEGFSDILKDEDKSTIRVEALAVAQKIKDMMVGLKVTDKATGELRPLRYSDIVILFRSTRTCGPEFVDVLGECNIPAHVLSQTGYFNAYEIQMVLNMLRILDNPYQDIPMTSILKSPMVGLDEEEMAELRVKNPDMQFSRLVVDEMNNATEGKYASFAKIYHEIRDSIADTPIHIIIQQIVEKFGFRDYVAAMPAGDKRLLNLNMLIEQAIAYERTSYKGLFHFVRYIDQLQKYEVDFGEAETVGENDDVVHIMTIHKSKGLEFPVVFVSGLGRSFNQSETKDNLVLHTSLGMGINAISGNPKVKRKSLIRTEIAKQIKIENLGEELRVLYVALTRAKEKLILSGHISDAQKTFQKYVGNINEKSPISYSQRVGANSYLDWIIPAILSYPQKYDIDFISPEMLASREAEKLAELTLDKAELAAKIQSADDSIIDELVADFNFEYKYKSQLNKKVKYSVSDIKHDSLVANYDKMRGEAEIPEFLNEGKEKIIPAFMTDFVVGTNNAVNPGALRGTAVHRVMECMDFSAINDLDVQDYNSVKEFIDNQITGMLQKKLITDDMAKLVSIGALADFIKNPVAKRMANADRLGLLFKEKPFVMEHDSYLVQGIIDVFWIEDDRIIVLDYKTDRVDKEDELVARYKVQLDLYADALARIFSTGDKKYLADESLIYSFRLKEVIRL